MDDLHFENLLEKCRSNDVDVKVDALTKLQVMFEAGSMIPDGESLIAVMKSCLRTPNQHLTAASLAALVPMLSILITHQPVGPFGSDSSPSIDAHLLRQTVLAFLPAGGVIDRLGDNREKTRDRARECLVTLGGLCFQAGGPGSAVRSREGKGPETPLQIFERNVRETGLGSKVWRVREQSILTLVHIRRMHNFFPIRTYLTPLVDCLEDTDGTVRECARQSVVELFTGPGVTDAARADLKKEMTKKGVRKAIVDGVQSRLFSGTSTPGWVSRPPSEVSSENGDAGKLKEYVPPSLALRRPNPSGAPSAERSRTTGQAVSTSIPRPSSRAAGDLATPTPTADSSEVPIVYIASSRDLENEFSKMLSAFEGKETEHNWAARDRSITRIRGMLKGDAHSKYFDTFISGLKGGIIDGTLKALASLRTTVATNTCSLYCELAMTLGTTLDHFCETMLTNLLHMASFTKKITAEQSQISVATIIKYTSPQPRVIIPLLWAIMQEKSVQARHYAVTHVQTYLEVHGTHSKHLLESIGSVDALDKFVRKSLIDQNVGVRERSRVCFWVYESIWHDKAAVILGSLDATAKKQLEKAAPGPEAAALVAVEAPTPKKKSSVAAAIAASRAKAKAIAASPPTLRHQATSTSHAVRATSPPSHPNNSPNSHQKVMNTSRTSRSVPGSPMHGRSASGNRLPASSNSQSDSRSSHSSPSPPPSPVTASHLRRLSTPLVDPARSRTLDSSTVRGHPLWTAPPSSPPQALLASGRPSIFDSLSQEESLLMAQMVPVPDDDSDMGESDLLSHSTTFGSRRALSPSQTSSQATPPSTLGSTSLPPSVSEGSVEDTLRARAEEAESAAQRLLEVVEPEGDTSKFPIASPGLAATPRPKALSILDRRIGTNALATPLNNQVAIMKQADLFKDSPRNGQSSLVDALKERRHESGWWLRRMTLIDQGTPLKATEGDDRVKELQEHVHNLSHSEISVQTLKKLALLCAENPVLDSVSPSHSDLNVPLSPSPFTSNPRHLPSPNDRLWTVDKNFDRLFGALMNFLDEKTEEEALEYGLIVLWEILENQFSYIEGRESEIFSVLFHVRYCDKAQVLEATNTIRDALIARTEPVYGLTTMHAALRSFKSETTRSFTNAEIKATTYAFGLMGVGKFLMRLPIEILEEELPRLKASLIAGLIDPSSLVIRESAAACIIAAQLVMRDETHLFTLLDGLSDEKKNLLTYLFDKHGVRGSVQSAGSSTLEKLEREMRRLDKKTNTPPRALAA